MIVKVIEGVDKNIFAKQLEIALDDLYAQGYSCEVQYQSIFCSEEFSGAWIDYSAMIIATPPRLQDERKTI